MIRWLLLGQFWVFLNRNSCILDVGRDCQKMQESLWMELLFNPTSHRCPIIVCQGGALLEVPCWTPPAPPGPASDRIRSRDCCTHNNKPGPPPQCGGSNAAPGSATASGEQQQWQGQELPDMIVVCVSGTANYSFQTVQNYLFVTSQQKHDQSSCFKIRRRVGGSGGSPYIRLIPSRNSRPASRVTVLPGLPQPCSAQDKCRLRSLSSKASTLGTSPEMVPFAT